MKRTKSILGLDIGSHSIKAVEMSHSGESVRITGLGRKVIPSPDQIDATIRELLEETGIKAKRVASAVSGRSVIVRYVPMVDIGEEDLKQAIIYEADKYIPFDVEESVIDCQKIDDPEAAGGQMKVLLVAAKRAVIDEHVALIERAGLEPYIVDYDAFALGNAFELRSSVREEAPDKEVVAGLIDLGAAKASINILRGGTSYFTREVYIAGNNFTEAIARRFGEDPEEVERMKLDPGGATETMVEAMAPVVEDIAGEVRLSFDYFENQFDRPVNEVYISGGAAIFPGMEDVFTKALDLPVKAWDPTEGIELSLRAGPGAAQAAPGDLAVAVGLAARVRKT